MAEEFSDLVERCLEGSATPEELESVRASVSSDDACRAQLDEAVLIDACLRASARDRATFAKRSLDRITRGTDRSAFATRTLERLRTERTIVNEPRWAQRFTARLFGPQSRPATRIALAVAATLLAAAILPMLLRGRADDESSTAEIATREISGRTPVALEPPAPAAHTPALTSPEEPSQDVLSPAIASPAFAAVVFSTRGEVEIVRTDSVEPAAAGAIVRVGERVRTGADGETVLGYPDGTRLTLSEHTSAALSELDGAKQVELLAGDLDASVSPQPPGAPMMIATANAHTTVVGTSLRLSYDSWLIPAGGTRLEVTSGMVEFARSDGGRAVSVLAGEYALVSDGMALEARQLMLDLSEYSITFDEEFDELNASEYGPCGPDGSRWMTHTPYNGDFGAAAFGGPGPGSPFTIDGGILRIEARRDNDGHWRSGLLASVDAKGRGFLQRRGYFECRMKLPPGPGTWPAFWLNSWGTLPESDAAEDRGASWVVINQYGDEPHMMDTEWQIHRANRPGPKWGVSHAVPDTTREFHTYGCLIERDRVSWYYDRKELRSIPAPPEAEIPVYVLVDLAMGGERPIDLAPSPSHLYVDFIKVYAKQAPEGPAQ